MVLLARIVDVPAAPEGEEKRSNARRLVSLAASARQASDRTTAIRIHNLSRTGLLLEADDSLEIGDIFLLDLPEIGATPARVRRKQGQAYGCEFLSPVTQGALSAALLKSSFSADEDDAAVATLPVVVESQIFRRDPRVAETFAIAIPFCVLLGAFAFALASLQFG